ncbi:SMR domain-containing protein At5g58720-like [Argentina anserina]|uniref:SMR domain-containing protein At5g58720-like n=1 Tax=Argentina anserina TaxID=57926 RepID=UPI002176514D|nr:SMR domain-containing protein At5g58720-like [Potentilla anserina]
MTSRYGVAATRQEEEAEQFLWSMLGDESELNLGVVRDVLFQCGYEVEKALDAFLELSSSSSSETWYCVGDTHHSYVEVLAGSTSGTHRCTNTDDISQMVVESFFNKSKRRRTEKEPRTINSRKKSVKQVQDSLDVAKGAEYDAYRGSAKQHWQSVTSHYQKAANAYSSGSRAYAGYLSEQAKVKAKLAREADEKASQEIFKARNKDKGVENDVMTIDLHGQHVKQAMRLLKLHLADGAKEQSLRRLRVITGCGARKSILKQSVIRLVQNEGIKWREENPGAVVIKLASLRQVQVHG